MSAEFLANIGYHYTTPGGFPWEKIHPGTLLAGMALAARVLAARRPGVAASRIVGQDRNVLLYLFTVALAAAHAALISKLPVTGLVDTFLLPVLLFWFMQNIDPRVRRSLGLMICALLCLNGAIGLAEYLTGWRLVSVPGVDMATIDLDKLDPTLSINLQAALGDWRSTALLGHPLENALVTGALILCLSSPGARWLPAKIRFPLLALSVMAMVAFGGRASLVLSLAGMVVFGAFAFAKMLLSGERISRRVVAGLLIGVPFIATAALAAASSGFFDRLILRFVDDAGSANARIKMWEMFAPLTWTDIMVGPDPALVATTQRILGIELGIESFWVALTLIYGLIAASLLFLGLILLTLRVVMVAGPGGGAVMLFYFIVASSSTSLASKTTGFALVILMVLALLQADRAGDLWTPHRAQPKLT